MIGTTATDATATAGIIMLFSTMGRDSRGCRGGVKRKYAWSTIVVRSLDWPDSPPTVAAHQPATRLGDTAKPCLRSTR
jgi:hypothetical protein